MPEATLSIPDTDGSEESKEPLATTFPAASVIEYWHEMLAELSVHFTSIGKVIGLSALKHISGEPFSEIEQN